MDEIAHSLKEHWASRCQAPFAVTEKGCNNLKAVLDSLHCQTAAWKLITKAFTDTSILRESPQTRAKRCKHFFNAAFKEDTDLEKVYHQFVEKRNEVRNVQVRYMVPIALFIEVKDLYRSSLETVKRVCQEVQYFVEEKLVHGLFLDTDIRNYCRCLDLWSEDWVNFLREFNNLCHDLDIKKKRKASDDDLDIAIPAKRSRAIVRSLANKVLATDPADSAVPAPAPPPHLPTTPSIDTASVPQDERAGTGTTDTDGTRASPPSPFDENASVPLQTPDTWASTLGKVHDIRSPVHGPDSVSSNPAPNSSPLHYTESRDRMHNQAGGLVLPPLPASLPSPSDQSFPQSYRSTPGSLREHSTELIRRPGSRFPSGATPMIQAANISPSASSLPSIGQVVGGGHASNMPLTVFPDHPGRSQASAPSHALGSTFDGVVDPVSGRISAFHARSSPDLTPPTCTPIPREALNQAPDAPFFVPTQELPGDLEFLLNTPNYWVYDPGPVAFSQTVLGCEWVTQVRMYVPMVLIDGYVTLHVASEERQRLLRVLDTTGQIAAGAHLFGGLLDTMVSKSGVYPLQDGEYLICLMLSELDMTYLVNLLSTLS